MTEKEQWIVTSFVDHLRTVAKSLDVPIDSSLDISLKPQVSAADPEGRVAIGPHNDLWRHIALQTGARDFAVAAAAACRPASLGIVGQLIGACRDLSEATVVLERYGNLVGPSYVAPRIRSTQGRAAVVFTVPRTLAQNRERGDVSALSTLNVLRALTLEGEACQPVEVRLQHKDPKERWWYEDTFRCPVSFDCAETVIVLSIGQAFLEDVVLRRPYGDLHAYLRRQVEALLQWSNHQVENYTELVRDSVSRSLHLGTGSLTDAASRLGVSERTLQRYLRSEGTNFEQILDATRRDLANSYLEGTSLSVREIARLVGYNEASQFNRAFRRWNPGIQPSEYRKRRWTAHALEK